MRILRDANENRASSEDSSSDDFVDLFQELGHSEDGIAHKIGWLNILLILAIS